MHILGTLCHYQSNYMAVTIFKWKQIVDNSAALTPMYYTETTASNLT